MPTIPEWEQSVVNGPLHDKACQLMCSNGWIYTAGTQGSATSETFN